MEGEDEEDRARRVIASLVIATLMRLRQEMDNRSAHQNPREELEDRRLRAAAAEGEKGE